MIRWLLGLQASLVAARFRSFEPAWTHVTAGDESDHPKDGACTFCMSESVESVDSRPGLWMASCRKARGEPLICPFVLVTRININTCLFWDVPEGKSCRMQPSRSTFSPD